jgi:hypothetical protein
MKPTRLPWQLAPWQQSLEPSTIGKRKQRERQFETTKSRHLSIWRMSKLFTKHPIYSHNLRNCLLQAPQFAEINILIRRITVANRDNRTITDTSGKTLRSNTFNTKALHTPHNITKIHLNGIITSPSCSVLKNVFKEISLQHFCMRSLYLSPTWPAHRNQLNFSMIAKLSNLHRWQVSSLCNKLDYSKLL